MPVNKGEVLHYRAGVYYNPTHGGGNRVSAVYAVGCNLSPEQAQFLRQGASEQNTIPSPGLHHQFAELTHKINSLLSFTTPSFTTLSSPGTVSK